MQYAALTILTLSALCLASCNKLRSSDFSAQYVTLPNGSKAFCNRQGYREVRRTYTYDPQLMVTNPDGSFVPSDARVGPEWDDQRTSATGSLLTPDQMDQAVIKHEQEKENSPEAVEQRRTDQSRLDAGQFAELFINSGCDQTTAQSQAWFAKLSDADKLSTNWAKTTQQFRTACAAEMNETMARSQAAVQQRKAAFSDIETAMRACNVPYDAARAAQLQEMTPEGGARVADAATTRNACTAALEQKRVELESGQE